MCVITVTTVVTLFRGLDPPRGSTENRAMSAASPPVHARPVPDAAGRFGAFGGRYVPETLTRALDELAAEYEKARQDASFQADLDDLLTNYVGRPSPLYFARRLTEHCGGAQIWLKRE